MQLVAYGAQDIYLTGNPQITFFKVVYRRHTNFSMESIRQDFNGGVDFGRSYTSVIQRNGDLIKGMSLEFDVGQEGGGVEYCSNIGTALINSVELEIGGQSIDKHTGHWLETYFELTNKPAFHCVDGTGTKPSTIPQDENFDGTTLNKFQSMTYSSGVSGRDGVSNSTIGLIRIPLQFSFCRHTGLSLPLIALQYHEVKILLDVQEKGLLVNHANRIKMNNCELWVDYIYLDTDERRRFAQVSHEYLIEQVQENKLTDQINTHDLNFNHPVKELIFAGEGASSFEDLSVGPSTPSNIIKKHTYYLDDLMLLLKLNGHDRFTERNISYFTNYQVLKHHTGSGGCLPKDTNNTTDYGNIAASYSIGVYSFALKPEEHQPSGTCNFSRIDTSELILRSKNSNNPNLESNLVVYAVNYNVLRIMSGMGGLAYSN